MKDKPKHEILSYGGGTQTAAMCVLVAEGILPRPDAIIAADTGREMPTTWEYLNNVMRPYLATHGLEVHVADHSFAYVDIYAHNGDLLLPMFTKNGGKLPTFCSREWKADVVKRYARKHLGFSGTLISWLGFSLDEKKRVKNHDDRRYPLIDLMLTANECRAILQRAGLSLPNKSRCWMCPHHTNELWRDVRDNHPELWRQAIELEREISDNNDGGPFYLHRSTKPLDQAPIDEDDKKVPSRQCGLGVCFV